MFVIKSYVLKPDKSEEIDYLDDRSVLNNNPKDFFVEISEINKKNATSLNFDYLRGAIYIKYNKEIILDFTNLDWIDDLWWCLLNLAEVFLKKTKVTGTFPRSGLDVQLIKVNQNEMTFSLEGTEWKVKSFKSMAKGKSRKPWRKTTTVPRYEFLKALFEGAEHFFRTMTKFNEEYKYGLEKAKELKAQLR